MTQPPYGSGPPAGNAASDDKMWILAAHFGGVLFGFIPSLVAYLVKGKESAAVRTHAAAALNFQIFVAAVYLVVIILQVCAAFVLPTVLVAMMTFVFYGIWIGNAILSVMAGIKANNGELYRYPTPVRLVS